MDVWKMHCLILDEVLGTHAYVEVEFLGGKELRVRCDGELIKETDPFYLKVIEFVNGFNDTMQGRTDMP